MNVAQFTILLIAVLIFCSSCGGDDEEGNIVVQGAMTATDQRLTQLISQRNLTPSTQTAVRNNVTLLGDKLFNDVNLSGNKDISCATCHDPNFGTSDALSLSIGTGAMGDGPSRTQIIGVSKTIRRHSPQLFNLGQENQVFSFYDGRVQLINGNLTTPVNLETEITQNFDKVIDAQAIFPLVSNEEMLGTNGSNDIATSNDEKVVWANIIAKRILTNDDYVSMFNSAYPQATTINIGHVGNAIGTFIKNKFIVTNTPYDRYLLGDSQALSENQKNGLITFLTRGQCIQCHSGPNLTDNQLHSVGVPHIFPLNSSNSDDTGRHEITGNKNDLYKFKTPGLRNIGKTAPFMHNGAFPSLEEVVDHYNNIATSLSNYAVSESLQAPYQEEIRVDKNEVRQANRFNAIDNGRLKRGLGLSQRERSDLVDFLRNGLSN